MFTRDVLLVGQIKYILNTDTKELLCNNIQIPLSFDSHFHVDCVKVHRTGFCLNLVMSWTTSLDTHTVDDKLHVGLRHYI